MKDIEKISSRELQLRSILARVVAEPDLKKVLDLILKNGVKFLNMDSGGIILYDKEIPERISHYSAVNIPIPYSTRIINEKGGVIAQVISQKKMAILQDFTADTPIAKIWHGLGFKIVIVAPFIYQNELVGLIYLGSTDPQRTIDPFEEESVQIYAEYAGIAIHNTQMLEELREYRAHLEQLVAERVAELKKTNEQLQQEMTERKKTEEAFRESEERYRTLVQNVPVAVYRTIPGPKGKYLMANPTWFKIFGFDSEEELKEIAVADVYMNPEERKAFSDNLLAKGSVEGVELALRKKDGTPFWGSVTARVVYDENGKNPYFDCTIMDITDRKKAEEEQRRLMKDLEETNKIMVGRELTMVELKKKVNRLNQELGRPAPYDVLILESKE